MTADPSDRDNFCYRHPDRQSFILCQRCGRTICPSCQTQASVGVHCPECVKEARANAPKRPPLTTRFARAARGSRSGRPVVTYTLIAISVLVFVAQTFGGDLVTFWLRMDPSIVDSKPFSPLTSIFAHGGILHLGLNMLSLFFIGPILENALGRWRYLALYLIAGLGGSAAVSLLGYETAAVGASGSIFGLLAALVVLQRGIGGDVRQLLVILGLNLVIGFFAASISWQAHVGGIAAGAAVGLVLLRTRNVRQRGTQIGLLIGIGAILLAVIFVSPFVR